MQTMPPPRTTTQKGGGLGLTICHLCMGHNIEHAHAGNVWHPLAPRFLMRYFFRKLSWAPVTHVHHIVHCIAHPSIQNS